MSTINFNDSVFVQEALNAFVANLLPIRTFTRDFSGFTTQKGAAIAVPLVSVITATTFAQSYTGSGGTVNTVTVTVDKHRITTVDLTDVQQLNSSAAVITQFAQQQGRALAKIVLTDIMSIITTGTFGNAVVTTAAANYSKTQIRMFRKALAQANVDMSMLSLVLDTETYDAVLGDSNISQAMQYGGAEAIRDGKIPRALGFDLYESNIIPLNGVSLTAFACHPDAIAVAMRGFATVVPSGEYQAFEQVTDPASGISMTYRRYYDGGTGKMYGNFECLFGYAAALTLGLKIGTVP